MGGSPLGIESKPKIGREEGQTSTTGVCPGNNESAGKRKSSRVPSGNVYLKSGLVEAANAAARAKGTYLRDKFFRLVAIAHKILVAIYHMLSQQVSYNDLGDLYLDKLNKNHLHETWFIAWNVWATRSH